MLGYFKNLLSGTSSAHFANAAHYTKDATVAIGQAAINTACAGGYLTATGTQVAAAVFTYKVIAGEAVGTNAQIQTGAMVAKYLAPHLLSTKALGIVAAGSTIATKLLISHPVLSVAATVGGFVLSNPTYAKAAAQTTASAAYKVGEAGVDIVGAGLEITAGTALLAKETALGINDYLAAHAYDRQNGKGVDGSYTFKDLILDKSINEFDTDQFSGDSLNHWTELSGFSLGFSEAEL